MVVVSMDNVREIRQSWIDRRRAEVGPWRRCALSWRESRACGSELGIGAGLWPRVWPADTAGLSRVINRSARAKPQGPQWLLTDPMRQLGIIRDSALWRKSWTRGVRPSKVRTDARWASVWIVPSKVRRVNRRRRRLIKNGAAGPVSADSRSRCSRYPRSAFTVEGCSGTKRDFLTLLW